MRMRRSGFELVSDGILYVILSLFMLLILLPLCNVIASSFATSAEVSRSTFLLFPSKISISAYRSIFSNGSIIRALGVSIFIASAGTAINMFFTCLTAYSLSDRNLFMRKYIMSGIVFIMLFNPGIVAIYLTIRFYGLLDSYLALLLPGAISVFYLIILKNFFQDIPEELKEAATIDGCNPLTTFVRIILPLSTPAVITIMLFYIVDHWNSYFSALIYISDPKKMPITIVLRQLIISSLNTGGTDVAVDTYVNPISIRMATIVVALAPILGLYPFLQKYFQKGLLLGSVKG